MRKISIHISQGQRPFSFLARCARTNSLSSGERNGKSLNSFVVTQVVTNEGCKARRINIQVYGREAILDRGPEY